MNRRTKVFWFRRSVGDGGVRASRARVAAIWRASASVSGGEVEGPEEFSEDG